MHSLAFTYVTHATLLGFWSTCWCGVGVRRRDRYRGGLCNLVLGGRPRSQSPCWIAGDCNEWTTGLYIFFAAKMTECPVAESIKVAHWVSEWVEGCNTWFVQKFHLQIQGLFQDIQGQIIVFQGLVWYEIWAIKPIENAQMCINQNITLNNMSISMLRLIWMVTA